MRRGRASWTAEITAIYRAVEALRPADRRLVYDPHAHAFLRAHFRLLLKSPPLARAALWFWVERRFPGGYDSIVARIRCVDDCLQRALAQGIGQVVILGAGFDARAYRFQAQLSGARVFEADHPLTQRVKKRKVIRRFGRLPDHVTYVPIDFETESLDRLRRGGGYTAALQTLFIWEGVTKYLTSAAVSDVLGWISANSAPGSRVVFDYLLNAMLDGRWAEPHAQKILAYQRRKGEPYRFGVDAGELAAWLIGLGYSAVQRTTLDDLKRLYLQPLNRGKRLHTFYEIAEAMV
jgi:methyltransferase (TIGR00027 family)